MAERLFVRFDGSLAGGSARFDGETPHEAESSALGNTMVVHRPCAPLRTHVTELMVYREELPRGGEVLERVLPDGSVRLVFNLGDAPGTGPETGHQVAAIGASSTPALVRLSGRMHGITATVRAGAAGALLGLPAGELMGTAVHLDEVWRGVASRLLGRLAEARHDAERIALLERALLEQLRRGTSEGEARAIHAASLIRNAAGRLSVGEVAAAVRVGERRLQQLFHEHVGLSPRALSRIARLHACLRGLRAKPRPGWAQLAREAGYYDQAHLANEFRALSGLSPSLFLEHSVSGSSKTGG